MNPFISVVIPNRNGSASAGKCLEALYASDYRGFEVVVVDDCSTDGSAEIVKKFPCRLIELKEHSGASAARNAGAKAAKGKALFFIDSDCVVNPDTLSVVAASYKKDAAIGGTYTPLSFDGGFYDDFQSLFVHYSESKKENPDYIATHAMLIDKDLFHKYGGFREDFMPILEDVEFSHRIKADGVRLIMKPGLEVGHIFDFNLFKSLKNAYKKSKYWTVYSLINKDMFGDSGTASLELKADCLCWFLCATITILSALTSNAVVLTLIFPVYAINTAINGSFLSFIKKSAGALFAIKAFLYYSMVYPVAVISGGIQGVIMAAFSPEIRRKSAVKRL